VTENKKGGELSLAALCVLRPAEAERYDVRLKADTTY
jgi:hypothetical protein